MESVNKDKLERLGSKGVIYMGDGGIQIIFGARAQFISSEMERSK
jgi:PTS system D-glucosamine-specific IIC component